MKLQMRIICFSLFVFQFFGCSENEEIVSSDPVAAELSIEEQIMALPNNEFENVELVSLYAESMREILTMAKDPEFRDFIYDSAVDYEKTGQDFDVNFSTIVKAKKSSAKFGNSVSVLENLSSQLKSKSSGRSSMVFFPRAETLEESAKTTRVLVHQKL